MARRNRGRNRGGEVGGMGSGCSLYSVMVRGRNMGYRYIVLGSVYFAYIDVSLSPSGGKDVMQ